MGWAVVVTVEPGCREADDGKAAGQGVQELCRQLASARCPVDHLRFEDSQRLNMLYEVCSTSARAGQR